MFGMQMIRIMAMRWMNEPKNKLLEPASLAYKTLFGTIFEADANVNRNLPEEAIDINKCIDEGTSVAIKKTPRSRDLRGSAKVTSS